MTTCVVCQRRIARRAPRVLVFDRTPRVTDTVRGTRQPTLQPAHLGCAPYQAPVPRRS